MALRSLGKITVASAGTPIQVTVNQSVPAARLGCQSISVYVPTSNAGANAYIGIGASFNKGTYVNLLGIIPKGTWWNSVINLAPAALNAADYYIDVDTNNDIVLVAVTEQ